MLDTDDGARYVGEFSLGLNPYIDKPMKDSLFDEKIRGSFHFTPGSCYDECNNGNKSAIHGIWFSYKDLSTAVERFGLTMY